MRMSMHFQMKRYRNGLTGSLQGMHNMASVCGQLYSIFHIDLVTFFRIYNSTIIFIERKTQ